MIRPIPTVCACPACKMPIHSFHFFCLDCTQAGCTALVAACVPDAAAVLAAWERNSPARIDPPAAPSHNARDVAARRALVAAFKARNTPAPADQDDRLRDILGLDQRWNLSHLDAAQAATVTAVVLGGRPTGTEHTAAGHCWCVLCVQARAARLRQGDAD